MAGIAAILICKCSSSGKQSIFSTFLWSYWVGWKDIAVQTHMLKEQSLASDLAYLETAMYFGT